MESNKTILVAGATGSIGGAAAEALARRGVRVVLLGRSAEKLERRAERVRAAVEGAVVEKLVIDFADLDATRAAAEQALSRFETIDGLVLSVAAYLQGGPTILSNGHEVMFATNVLGPFLFTELLAHRMVTSDGIVLHVIAPFTRSINWDDLESIKHHRTSVAFDRTKTLNRTMAAEMARRYKGCLVSLAFDPTYVIDKADPELADRWPKGLAGLFWRLMTVTVARHPDVAGKPIAELMTNDESRDNLNGSLYKLTKRVRRANPAMQDVEMGRRLWDALTSMTAAPDAKTGAHV